MFCDGQCIKKSKFGKDIRCGQLFTIRRVNNLTGESHDFDDCSIRHMVNQHERIEALLIRIENAITNSRDQQSADDHRTSNIVAVGMAGLMYAMKKDGNGFEETLKFLDKEMKQPLQLEKDNV